MSDDHLDAETLAAWVDGGLDAKAAAMVETHVSSCDRCQEIVGLIVTTEAAAVPAKSPESWLSRIRAGWLIPLTAGVAAVGLWMIVPANRPVATPVVQEATSKEAPAAPPAEEFRARDTKRQQPEPAKVDELAKNLSQATSDRAAADKDKKEAKLADQQGARVDRFEDRTAAAAPTAAAAAPAPARAMAPPAPAAEALGRLNQVAATREITSPVPRTRWRLLDAGNVEYSRDGGATWETVSTGVNQPLTAGSSPTADVCWLVGRNGTVLLTTDGRRWQRLAFPEAIDLASVIATDARSAQVTAANGTSFRTTDGGLTWMRP